MNLSPGNSQALGYLLVSHINHVSFSLIIQVG
jgi:hypothetical protein